MAFSELFTDVLDKIDSISVQVPVASPKKANNYQKTDSNVNRKFKLSNIWNDQIDREIIEEGYIIKCPACFIEFLPEEPMQVLGGVTQYMNAKMYFHIFSDQLNNPNSLGGDKLDRNTEIYDLRDLIKSKFLGFHTHNSSAMMSRYDQLDYKHKTITKYLLGFSFCFNDDKGSIFDPNSDRYLESYKLTGATLSVTRKDNWISGCLYVSGVNVVYFEGVIEGVLIGWYLCTTTNNSTEFTPLQWQYLALWQGGNSYTIGEYIYLGYYAYICIEDNNDNTFTENKWNLITRI